MNNILYLILHTNNQPDRYDNILNTWGKNCDFIFYSDHSNPEQNIIQSSYNSDYRSAEEKFCNVVNQIPEKYRHYDWFFFCDNDTFVNTKLMNEKLKDFSKNKVYGEVINSYSPDFSLSYFSGGAGYLVPKSILEIMKKKLRNYNTGYSDVTFGYFMREFNIEFEDSKLFNSQPHSFFNIDINDTPNYISFHYIKSLDKMEELYNLIK